MADRRRPCDGVPDRSDEAIAEESDGQERVVQWLQALDLQVVGACRTDERLKPMLKIVNASNGVAEDRLLAHLSQHFEPVEVGMLARCFCIPLVSIRAGRIEKQGTLLCPTSARGNLNLTVLPTSGLRLSFAGDDGHTERLFTLSVKTPSSAVEVNEIAADNSGRSFLVKAPEGKRYYFWCAEKSKLLGLELLAKMKDFLVRRPSIAELTGISESRLGCFATHLRAYLVGSAMVGGQASSAVAHTDEDFTSDLSETPLDGQFTPSSSSKYLRSRHPGSLAARANSSFQGSLSPRSSSFKEGLPRNLSSLKTSAREKLRRRGDSHLAVENLIVASAAASDGSSNPCESDKGVDGGKSCSLPISCVDALGKLPVPSTQKSDSQIPLMGSPLLSPYYCWCPPGSSTLQFSAEPSLLPAPFLPPLSSLLPATLPSTLLAQTSPFSLIDSLPLDFPAFLPDPLVRLPMATAPQIPTFTPLICDPIVHIPVIDVCSSGPGYLVSAGPTLSTSIPPLPLIPKTDSLVEQGARETLRLLINSSSQTNPTRVMDENPGMIVAGSRGLYSGTRDVDVIASSIAAIGLVSLSGRSNVEAAVEDGSRGVKDRDAISREERTDEA